MLWQSGAKADPCTPGPVGAEADPCSPWHVAAADPWFPGFTSYPWPVAILAGPSSPSRQASAPRPPVLADPRAPSSWARSPRAPSSTQALMGGRGSRLGRMEPRPKSGSGGVWQLWGWSLQFGLGCWLIGNQPAAEEGVSRGAVVRSASWKKRLADSWIKVEKNTSFSNELHHIDSTKYIVQSIFYLGF